jgi:hypothetical protein
MLNLVDEYTAMLEVIDADSSNGLSYKRVLSFKVNSSTTDGVILAPDVWAESPYADYSSDKFRLTIKGGDIPTITDFGNWA